MKKLIAIILLVILSSASVNTYAENLSEYYPLLTVIVDKDYWSDGVYVLTAEDDTGNLWAFIDENGIWTVGDIVNFLMKRVSDLTEEDEIAELYWCGRTDNIEEFYQIMGWDF
jgi:hypothetical protein